jgi:hypothetical protein
MRKPPCLRGTLCMSVATTSLFRNYFFLVLNVLNFFSADCIVQGTEKMVVRRIQTRVRTVMVNKHFCHIFTAKNLPEMILLLLHISDLTNHSHPPFSKFTTSLLSRGKPCNYVHKRGTPQTCSMKKITNYQPQNINGS